MKIAYITPKFLLEVPRALEALGHVLVEPNEKPEAIICMSVSQMKQTWEAIAANPGVPLYVYNWDVYDWSLKTPRPNEYDWASFKLLCERAAEVWVPSIAEKVRYERWTGKHAHLLKSAVPFWNLPDIQPKDGRFVLDTLRETPDPHWGMAARACAELGIPFLASKHGQGYARYAELLATCTMTVSTLLEASTGGFGLVEANWYGKMALFPNNPENAALEYVIPGYGRYYEGGDYTELKAGIQAIWKNPAPLKPDGYLVRDVRKEIKDLYSAEGMARRIHDRITV